jgi:glycosyltransferase involved in cell wall biosynthesis
MLDTQLLTVSVIIKALNEERYIAAAIESALAAVKGVNGEVILADSASTDRTCEIARRYPIKIVRMTRTEDRSCGAGAQLGYQYSRGRYLCLIDGDMRMRPDFLAQAVRFLDEHPDVAGVGGMSMEHETSNLEYLKRNVAEHAGRQAGIVARLDGTGVYRRAAIESIGHLTDRNLHGGEELELGARLVADGWKLARLAVPDVDHYGHTGNAYRLLLRRWNTRMAYGIGEVLRAAIGQPHLPQVLRAQRRTLVMLALLHAWWLCLLGEPMLVGGLSSRAIVLAALAALPIAAMSWRFRSLKLGVYSVVAWHVYAAGFWVGLLRRRVPPTDWIASTVLQDATASDGVRRARP